MGVKLIKQFFFDVEVIILMDVSGERLRYACYIGFAGSDIYTYDICFEGSLGADLEWCFSEYMAITKETKDIDEAESKGNGG